MYFMKKILCAALAVALAGCMFSGCSTSKKEDTPPEGFLTPPEMGFLVADQFVGYKLGTVPSLVPEKTIKDAIPGSYVLTYKNATKALHSLAERDIHGMVLPVLYADEEIRRTPGIGKIEQTFIEQPVCAIFLNNSNYVLPADAAFTSIKATGKAKKIALSHSPYASDEIVYTRPTEYEKVPGRVVRIGICSDENYPYNYKKDGELVGINVDVAYEVAAGANAELEIKEYPKNKLEEALKNKEVDIILSDYSCSDDLYEEGSDLDRSFLYSESYYDASLVIVVKNEYLGNSRDILASLQSEGQAVEVPKAQE